MDPIRAIAPVLPWKTKGFWLGLFPAILTFIDVIFQTLTADGSEPVADAIATVLNLIGVDVTGVQIVAFMRSVAPLYVAILFWQRGGFGGGIPRPYTLDPKEEKRGVEVVLDTRK